MYAKVRKLSFVFYAIGFLLILAVSDVVRASIGTGKCAGFALEDYGSCGSDGNLDDLYYAYDTVVKFAYKCDNYEPDWDWNVLWGGVYAKAFVEDGIIHNQGVYGTDHAYIDNSEFVYIVNHGWIVTEYVFAWLRGNCCEVNGKNYWDSYNCKLGEENGTYASPYVGLLKFFVAGTCHSMELDYLPMIWYYSVDPDVADLHAIMGFDGLYWIGYTTDEYGQDLVYKSIGSGWTLKGAWFWAIEDWWSDNTGVFMSWGETMNDAVYWLNNQKVNWNYDPEIADYFSWSYYEG